jgi:hypothetical protein
MVGVIDGVTVTDGVTVLEGVGGGVNWSYPYQLLNLKGALESGW